MKAKPTIQEAEEYILRSGDAYSDLREACESKESEKHANAFLEQYGLTPQLRQTIQMWMRKIEEQRHKCHKSH